MAESFWESQVAVETETDAELEQADLDRAVAEPAAQARALTVSMDDFSALEERIIRAVQMMKRERQARAAAESQAAQSEARAAHAEAALREQAQRLKEMEHMEAELAAMRAERDQVRQRVERLLAQLDALEM